MFRRCASIGLFLFMVVLFWHVPVHSQEPPRTCDAVRYFIANNTTPSELIQGTGEGALQPNQAVQGSIGRDDIGDYWAFVVSGFQGSTNINVQFSDIQSPYLLEFALFRGLERLQPYEIITQNTTYSLSTRNAGIYTIVVRLADFNDVIKLDTDYSYRITANFPGGGAIRDAMIEVQDIADRATYQPEFVAGQQIISRFPGTGARVAFHADSLVSGQNISSQGGGRTQLVFRPSGGMLVNEWATEIDFGAGDLYARDTTASNGRLFYLQDFGFSNNITTAGELDNLSDSNDTSIRTDWVNIQGLWVTRTCAGVRLQDGRSFVIELDPEDVSRDLIVLTIAEVTTLGCDASLVQGRTAWGQATICFPWEAVQANTEVSYEEEILKATLNDDRTLELAGTEIDISPLSQVEGNPSDSYPAVITVENGETNTRIVIDWVNVRSFALSNGELRLLFDDEVRANNGITIRNGVDLVFFEGLSDTIRILYGSGEERLLLPVEESYVEIVTPAGEPTFDGQTFDATALPTEPGYQPRALNNTGAECYPVNTMLAMANCPPNGHINPANGNLWYAITDHIAYGQKINLELTRSYNSARAAFDGPFGRGWTMPYMLDYNLPFTPETNSRVFAPQLDQPRYPIALDLIWTPRGLVNFMTDSGSRHAFTRREDSQEGSETYVALTMPGWVLTRADIRSNWQLTYTDGYTLNFDRAGRIRQLGYPEQDRIITIDYPYNVLLNGPGELDEEIPVIITDAAQSRQIELYYNDEARVVRSVLRDLSTSSTGETCELAANCFVTQYSYENDFLTGVIYADGQEASYQYDGAGQLIRHSDLRAPVSATMAYEYAPEQNGVQAVYILNAGEITPQEGSLLWRSLETTSENNNRRVTVTDEFSNTRTYTYELTSGQWDEITDSYTLIDETSPLAPAGGFEAVPIGYTWENGLLTQQETRAFQQNQGRNSISYEYAPDGRIRTIGGTTGAGYPFFSIQDEQLRIGAFAPYLPEVVQSGDGLTREYIYDTEGRISSITDNRGAQYHYIYDEQNRILRLELQRETENNTFTLMEAWEYSYQELGFPDTVTRFSNLVDDPGYRIRYTWDALGRPTTINDDIIGTYSIEYLPASVGTDFITEVRITDPVGAYTINCLNGKQQLIETRMDTTSGCTLADESTYLQRTTYTYDPLLGYLTSETHHLRLPDNAPEITPLTTHYRREPLIELIDPDSTTTFIGGYRLVKSDPYGRETVTVYDALGRVRQMQDTFSNSRIDYFVDGIGDLPTGANNFGLRIEQRDYRGTTLAAQNTYIFDLRWQLRQVRRVIFNADGSENWDADWTLFPNNQVGNNINPRQLSTSIGLPDLLYTQETYLVDQPRELRGGSARDGIQDNIAADYDYLGRISRISQTVQGTPQVTYLLYCSLANGQERVIRSQINTEITCNSSSAEIVQALTYDAHQRLIRVEDDFGIREFVYQPGEAPQTWQVQIIASSLPTGDSVEIITFNQQMIYDASGNLIAWLDEDGFRRNYVYDTVGQLRRLNTSIGDGGEPVAEESFIFDYNKGGLLTRIENGIGRGTRYDFDARGLVTLVQDISSANTTTYNYDENGLLTAVTSPLGTVTNYEYDDFSPPRLSAIITPTQQHNFEWLTAINTLRYTNPRGQSFDYHYSSVGQLAQIAALSSEGDEDLYRLEFNYDPAGDLRGMGLMAGEIQRNLTIVPDRTTYEFLIEQETGWNWRMGFTPFGNLQLIDSGSGPLHFSYDPLAQLNQVRDGENILLDLTRENGSPLLSYRLSDHTQTLRYDTTNRLETLTMLGEDAPLHQYTYAANGDTLNLRIENGVTMRVYTFFPGSDIDQPTTTLRLPGRKITYSYDTLLRVDTITYELCLAENAFDLVNFPLEDFRDDNPGNACGQRADGDNDIWRTNIRIIYDAEGRPIRTVDERQNVETFTYDNTGNLTFYQNQAGQTYTYQYDSLNQLSSVVNPVGIRLLMSYEYGSITGICRARAEDPADYDACAAGGGTVLENYDYDSLGRLIGIGLPEGIEDRTISYDGNQLSAWTSDGIAFTFYPGAIGLLSAINVGSTNYEFTYDSQSRLSAIEGYGGLEYQYDALGQLIGLQGESSNLSITYDGASEGYRIEDTDTGQSLHYGVLPNGRLFQISTTDEAASLNIDISGLTDDPNSPIAINLAGSADTDLRANTDAVPISLFYYAGGVDFIADLNPADKVQRQLLSETSFDRPPLNQNIPAQGYLIALGYDEENRPLLLRINDADRGNLYFSQSFRYDLSGRLIRETRQYADESQVNIIYNYNTTDQLIERIVRYSAERQSVEQAGLGIIISLLLLAVGWRQRRRLIPVVVLTVLTSNLTIAQVEQQNQTYTYDYDNRGNLSRINLEGETCVSYAYDAANRLITVDSSALDEQVRYQYDAYHRLIADSQREIVYPGKSEAVVVAYEETGVAFFPYIEPGIPLLQARANEIIPMIFDSQQSVIGSQVSQTPLQLFDPFGRPLTIDSATSEQNQADNCGIYQPREDLEWANLPQIVFQGMMWDARTNLMFSEGRVYSPELRRFLQRDLLGPDDSGAVYAYPVNRNIPTQAWNPPHRDGLQQLAQAQANILLQNSLQAEQVAIIYSPPKTEHQSHSFYESLHVSYLAQQNQLYQLLDLPAWLARSYNLAVPQVNAQTGALLVSNDAAPGYGEAETPWYETPIWSGPYWTPEILATGSIPLPGLLSMKQPVTWQVQSYAMNRKEPSLDFIVQAESVTVVPRDIMSLLPIPIIAQSIEEFSLSEVEALDVTRTDVNDWLTTALESDLPDLPALPPENLDAILGQYFNSGILWDTSARQWPVPAAPNLWDYALFEINIDLPGIEAYP